MRAAFQPPVRHRRWRRSGGGVVLPDGVATLVSDLESATGVSGVVKGFYDVRQGLTLGGGGTTVTAWDDVRGAAGYGPQLTTGTAPAWDSANGLVVFNENAFLLSALSPLFDASPEKMIVLMGALRATSSDRYYAALVNSAGTVRMAARVFGTATLRTHVDSGSTQTANSTVAPSVTRRVLMSGKTAAVTCLVRVASQGAAVNAGFTGAFASEDFRFILGSNAAGGTSLGRMDLRAALVLHTGNTGAIQAALATFGTTYHGVVTV